MLRQPASFGVMLLIIVSIYCHNILLVSLNLNAPANPRSIFTIKVYILDMYEL